MHKFTLSLLLLALSLPSAAKEEKNRATSPSASSSIEALSYRPMRPNSVEAWFGNDARSFQAANDAAAFIWPAGSGRAAIFMAAPWVAAQFEGDTSFAGLRTAAVQNIGRNGTEYRPGKILRVGNSIVADNPDLPQYRIYHIRRGDDPITNPDFANWPIADGAPTDANGFPLVTGSESMWYVANDMVPGTRRFSQLPLGCELQQYMYGFRSDNPILNQTIFIKLRLINRNIRNPQNPNQGLWKNAYVAMYIDADVGDAGDDLVGCDTLTGLAYTYNGTNNDPVYGAAPPAVGFLFLNGRIGSTPIRPSAHVRIDNAGGPLGEPETNRPDHVYNFMRCLDKNGNSLGNTAPGSRFMFPGDPETGQGIIEIQMGDKRNLLVSGPFDVAAGDTVEALYAVMIARGTSNLNSVTVLKQYATTLRSAFASPLPPSRLALYVNRGINPSLNQPFKVVIESQDAIGLPRPVAQNTLVQLSRTAGSGTLSGTQNAVILSGQSQAVIDNLAYNQVENGVQITVTRVSGDNLSPGSATFNVLPAATALIAESPLSTSRPATVETIIRIVAIRPDSTVDSNYARAISLNLASGPSAITGQTTQMPSNGVAEFRIAFPRIGSYTLQASSQGLGATTLPAFSIFPLTTFPVPRPQYAKIPSPSENSILPHCYLIELRGLTPNATYRYRCVTTQATSNFIAPNPNGFVRHQPPYPNDLSNKFGELTANADGTYRGWFILEMTGPGNPAGNILLNDGGNSPQIAYTVGAFSSLVSTNFFGTASIRATGVIGILPATIGAISTARKVVALYNNVQGTGSPLTTTYTEDDGTAPDNYPAFYQTSVNGSNGRFGTLLLNQSPNGIRRLELRDLNGNVLAFATSPDGVWGTVNTVNPSGGATQPLVIDFTSFLSASDESPTKPRTYRLAQNYPNPFNPSTTIAYQLPAASAVKLEVFDVLGRKVATLVDAKQGAGEYQVPFNAAGLSSGVYFYRLQAGDFSETKKMLLAK